MGNYICLMTWRGEGANHVDIINKKELYLFWQLNEMIQRRGLKQWLNHFTFLVKFSYSIVIINSYEGKVDSIKKDYSNKKCMYVHICWHVCTYTQAVRRL